MNPKNKFWWFAAVSVSITLIIISILAVLFWHHLSPEEKSLLINIIKQHFVYIFSAVFLLLAGLGFALDGIFHTCILPMGRLAEEATLINSVNPSHRIKIEGSKDIIRLAQIVNEAADRYEDLQNNVEKKIYFARAESEEEKNILAAIMSELPEGVLVCNAEGRILLYNKRVKQFLASNNNNSIDSEPLSESGRFIGLGRSVFGVIDKNLIVHALDEIAEKLKRKEQNIVSHFVIIDKGNMLLRVEAAPILSHLNRFTGFILIFYDITQQLEKDGNVDFILQSLAVGIRSSLAGIKAANEVMLEHPDMDKKQLNSFGKIINKESISIGNVLDKTVSDYSSRIKTYWPLVPMPGKDIVESIIRKAGEKLNILINFENCDEEIWIKVDSYSIILSMLFVLNELKNETGESEFTCEPERKGKFVNIDLVWKGMPIKTETLRKWNEQVLIVEKERISLTLKEVIDYHKAEIWSYSHKKSKDKSYLRLLLPVAETPEHVSTRSITILPESRPEFYDFDLFSQPGQIPELDSRPLTELTFTVFDTETTGLNPGGGDEIISIGAVRIVNCRLLHDELFNQFIDPQRSLPYESIRVHGIRSEMLEGQPTIDNVLPMFYRFVEDTVLVAHNAAFDMRMLQIKEAKTGVKFINPVIDTMLISAVVHPAHNNHNLEAIAGRLGISVVGRHTALGDAIATGEIFLKLIPLLAKKGIYTLKEARNASQKTYYSRTEY